MTETGDGFVATSVSIAGAPTIEFRFAGATCRAALGNTTLYAEVHADETSAMLRMKDGDGQVLADLHVLQRADRTITENVIEIGSALLWSNWRFEQARVHERSVPPTEGQ